jgi:hypothetical protein
MSGEPPNGLPDDWEALGRADAEALAPPAGAKDRVRAQVALTLGLGAALGVGTASSTAAGSTAAAGGAGAGGATAAGAAQAPAAQGAVATAAKVLALKKVTLVTVAAVTAMAGGTATYVEVQARREASRRIAAERQVAAEKQVASLTPAPTPVAPSAPATLPPSEPAIAPPPGPPPVDTLGEERSLLDRARLAIATGHLTEAQALLARHATAFPDGRLGEERQALQIRLLVRQGREQEAKHRAALFRKEHPGSIQLPVIDEALRRRR